MYVCMYVCMYVRTYVRMYVYTYVYILYIDTWSLACPQLGNSVLKVPVDASVIRQHRSA